MSQQLIATRYELFERIGAGGVALVYRARDRRLDRIVALKILRDEYADDAEFVERFQQESRVAAGLNHPNIVSVYDYGPFERTAFIAMEFVDGETLKDRLRRDGSIPVGDATRTASDVLSALAAAHAQGLVHRDVKPQNVLITRSGQVKLTDFGVAHAPASSGLTHAGLTLGTAAYLAPEQATGRPVSPATDIYGVGVLLYEMVTGRVPFQGEHALDVVYRHVHEAPLPPGQIAPGIPPALERAIMRALDKDPEKRFASAESMREALADVPIVAPIPPIDATTRIATHPSGARPPTVTTHPVRRGSLLVPLLALLGLLGLGGLAYLAAQRSAVPGARPAASATAISITAARPTSALISTLAAPTATVPAAPTVTAAPPAPTATTRPPAQPTQPPRPQPTQAPAAVATAAPAPAAVVNVAPTPAPTRPTAPAPATEIVLESNTFEGGYRNEGESVYRQRSAVWVYGTGTRFSTMTARFDLGGPPRVAGALIVMGLISEPPDPVGIAVLVNEVEIYRGRAPFANDRPGGDYVRDPAPWQQHSFAIPPGALRAGTNLVTFRNLETSSNLGRPWFMIDWARVQVGG